jgi:hypothetical protein
MKFEYSKTYALNILKIIDFLINAYQDIFFKNETPAIAGV